MNRRLRNEFIEENDELDYRSSYRNQNGRKRARSADMENLRSRSRNRPWRDRKAYDDY